MACTNHSATEHQVNWDGVLRLR